MPLSPLSPATVRRVNPSAFNHCEHIVQQVRRVLWKGIKFGIILKPINGLTKVPSDPAIMLQHKKAAFLGCSLVASDEVAKVEVVEQNIAGRPVDKAQLARGAMPLRLNADFIVGSAIRRISGWASLPNV